MGTIKRFEISEIRDKYGIDTFVETGTMYGESVDFALEQGFTDIYSIEIEDVLYESAKLKYINNDNVHILHGDSSQVLPTLLSDLDKGALFWLDAHFPGADMGLRTYESCLELDYDTRLPLEQELTAIAKHSKNYKNVVVADDLWIYEEGQYGAGSMNEHAKAHNQNITKETVCGKDASFAYNLFEETHEIKKYYPDQGYLVFLPKV